MYPSRKKTDVRVFLSSTLYHYFYDLSIPFEKFTSFARLLFLQIVAGFTPKTPIL
jgi:hypothetical protein